MDSYFSAWVLGGLIPGSIVCYQVVPRKVRPYILLIASYVFLWVMSGVAGGFVLASTGITWLLSLGLGACPAGKAGSLRRRLLLVVGILANLGVLVALKYLGFFGSLFAPVWQALSGSELPELPTLIAPIGISFYTMQALSYLIDVCRGSLTAEKSLPRIALYLSFFPSLMEGPISRYGQVSESLWAGAPITARSLYLGLGRALWGFAKRMLVANRVNAFVIAIFSQPDDKSGSAVAIAAALYTLQLYCDFSGTMDFALGIGQIFGVTIPENFHQPFFSKSPAEFWRRWHITLGAWLRDYIFYPISFSRWSKHLTSRSRKVLGAKVGPAVVAGPALFCVWVCNGLWHGAGTQYLFFGMYYFVLLWVGGVLTGWAHQHKLQPRTKPLIQVWHGVQHVVTILIIIAGELIFRAADAGQGVQLLSKIAFDFDLGTLTDGTLFGLGMVPADFGAVAVFTIVLFAVGVAHERNFLLMQAAWEHGALARWALWCVLIVTIAVFGAYGFGYVPVAPMYAQF